MKTLVFNAVSGFGNRILPIVCLYAWCAQYNVKMGVIWNTRAHRSGLPRDKSNQLLEMEDYFESIPPGIDVFSDRASALTHYSIAEDDVVDYDMQWQPQFDSSYLEHDHLLVYNCCHLISLYTGNESIVGQRVDLTPGNQSIYAKHPYIEMVKDVIRKFVFPSQTRLIGDQLFRENMVGLQLRNSDGGFTVNASLGVMNEMHSIIESSETIYFSNDRPSDLELVLKRHDNVIAYTDERKFLNNDMGTLYSLVDLYVLSRCKKICVASRSSFGLVAHLYSEDSTIDYWI